MLERRAVAETDETDETDEVVRRIRRTRQEPQTSEIPSDHRIGCTFSGVQDVPTRHGSVSNMETKTEAKTEAKTFHGHRLVREVSVDAP